MNLVRVKIDQNLITTNQNLITTNQYDNNYHNLITLIKLLKISEIKKIKTSLSFKEDKSNTKYYKELELRLKDRERELELIEQKYISILNDDCIICTLKLSDPTLLTCCQNFICNNCCCQWLSKNNNCPICRCINPNNVKESNAYTIMNAPESKQ